MMHTRTTMKRRPIRLVAFAAVAALALTACGGDDDTDAGGDATDDAGTTAPADDEGTAAGTDGPDVDIEEPTDCPSPDEVDVDGGETLAEAQEQGYLDVGIANEVPYGYQDDSGNVTGEAPEVAKRVMCELGVPELQAQVVEFGALIGGLQAGQFDMIAAGMYINAERAEQILFSDPDYCVGEAFAVPEGNPNNLTDFQSVVDNPDVTIAILSGAVEEGYAETAGIPDSQIQLFGDVNQQYEALAQGRVDAVTGTSLTVQNQVQSRQGFEATESFFPLDEDGEEILGCGGFGFRNDDQAFRDAYNDKLNELQDAGELLPVIAEFGFVEEDIERAQGLTVDDLAGE
jgi:polar amino acid transport system substrate-binding protein